MKFLISLLILNSSAWAAPQITPSGFIDLYYAYDFNRPASLEREYTTQPARHNEANINLAHISGDITQDKSYAKLTLQYGNSVSKNYSTEPALGTTSGDNDSKMIQEAYIGHKLSERTTLDAGIYLGHIGMESWISAYNWTYTRSLMLDYVPYYQAGLRLTHRPDSNHEWQIHLINGWQNVSENNQDKAIGVQYKRFFTSEAIFTYNNFLGNDKGVTGKIDSSTPSTLRFYQDFILQTKINERLSLLSSFDIGAQEKTSDKNHYYLWYVGALVFRYQLSEKKFIALRNEYYHDKNQVNVATYTPRGLQVYGASINYDRKLDSGLLWRNEARYFSSKDSIYPKKSFSSTSDYFLVSSVSYQF